MSQQHISVSQGRVCLDNRTCCYNEMWKLQIKLAISPNHIILTLFLSSFGKETESEETYKEIMLVFIIRLT